MSADHSIVAEDLFLSGAGMIFHFHLSFFFLTSSSIIFFSNFPHFEWIFLYTYIYIYVYLVLFLPSFSFFSFPRYKEKQSIFPSLDVTSFLRTRTRRWGGKNLSRVRA